ncbi:hypothetical protein E2C01_089078 [Portunus trituberculatus]|uniref:Uncharacterized protein n=1 Tax=Portunus trituberculatus TaxID=210409 RepID=A0A5B7JB10_PORTR|nr:hypothetical protein [Portunus trituberculatus]
MGRRRCLGYFMVGEGGEVRVGRAAPRDTSSNIRVVPLFSASLSSVSSPGVSHVTPRDDRAL